MFLKKALFLGTLIGIISFISIQCKQSQSKSQNVGDKKKDTLKKIVPAVVVDTTNQRILLIGDSMADGLGIPLAKYAKYNNHWFRKVSWQSSSILYWASADTLRKILALYKPTYVIISLGSNELFTKQTDAYRKYVQKIIDRVDTISQIWIEPPVWKPDNGLTAVMGEVIGSKRFYMSEKLNLDRGKDKIHPTFPGYHVWADSLCRWIMSKSEKPIKLIRPPDEIYKKYVSFPGETIVKPVKNDTTTKKNINPVQIQKVDSSIKH